MADASKVRRRWPSAALASVLLVLCSVSARCQQLEFAPSMEDYVGSHPGNPFTADIACSGSQNGELRYTLPLTHVARDQYGRIAFVRSHELPSSDWTTVVWDPVREEKIELRDAFYETTIVDAATKKVSQPTWIIHKAAIVTPLRFGNSYIGRPDPWPPRPETPDYVIRPERDGKGMEDAGWQLVNGVRLHGYRMAILYEQGEQVRLQVDLAARMKDIYKERYRMEPDTLGADMLALVKNQRSGMESRCELVHIVKVAPDPAIFRRPADYPIETPEKYAETVKELERDIRDSLASATAQPHP